MNNIHSSGHGNQEELKLMIRLIKPKYFMPFHGDYRMLKSHAELAVDCGIPKENTFIMGNGDVLSIKNGVAKKAGTVQAGDVYVDGNRIGDVSNTVLKDRKIMSNDGIVIIITNLDVENKKVLGMPNVTTRGFVLVNENEELLKKLEEISLKAINSKLNEQINYTNIKNEIVSSLSSYIIEKTGRKPIILPVIMNIKKSAN